MLGALDQPTFDQTAPHLNTVAACKGIGRSTGRDVKQKKPETNPGGTDPVWDCITSHPAYDFLPFFENGPRFKLNIIA